jgi:hypothetical protein
MTVAAPRAREYRTERADPGASFRDWVALNLEFRRTHYFGNFLNK